MILYHGSNIEVKNIDLSMSKPGKDFGRGFYLSDSETQALEMASYKFELFGGKPFVSKFDFDMESLMKSNLKIAIFKDYTLEWLDFVILNRRMELNELYDFVYGPIADDKVGRQLRKFFDKDITKEELLHRLKFMKGITFKYYFGTEKAINYLKAL